MPTPTNIPTGRHVKLPAIAWQVLLIMLAQPGWADTPGDIARAGLLEEKIQLPPRPKPDKAGQISPAADERWSATPVIIALTERESTTCTKCLKAAIAEKRVGGGRTAAALVGAFAATEN